MGKKTNRSDASEGVNNAIRKSEALWWLEAFNSGIQGYPFPPTKEVLTKGYERVMTPADVALASIRIVRDALVERGPITCEPTSKPEGSDGDEFTPPESAMIWNRIGCAYRDWLNMNWQEADRLVMEKRRSSGKGAGPASKEEKDYLGTAFRPPTLEPVIETCKHAAAQFENRHMFAIRLIVTELGNCEEPRRWTKLQEMGHLGPVESGYLRFVHAVDHLMQTIRRDLTYMACGHLSPIPRWQRVTGVLSFNDVVLKKIVVGKAENVVHILDQFEREGWCTPIDLKLEMKDQVLHQTLRSLNKDLERLRFRANGSGTHVLWEFKE